MKYANFIMKTISLLLVLAVLVFYQGVAQKRALLIAERDSEIAEVEAYNEEILAAERAAQAESESEEEAANNGTFEGSALGFGDDIVVSVTLEDGKITAIDVLEHSGEDDAYYEQAVTVLDKIMKAQTTEGVDAVAGATLTANGLIDAVADALSQVGE